MPKIKSCEKKNQLFIKKNHNKTNEKLYKNKFINVRYPAIAAVLRF